MDIDSRSIRFEVNLTQKDITNLMMYMARTRKALWIIASIYVCITLYFIVDSVSQKGISGITDNLFIICVFIVFLVYIPLLYYYAGRRSFKNNERLRETLCYEINTQDIRVEGDSFDSTFSWDKTYGASENKRSFFIWQQKRSANILPKRDLTSEDISFLREMAAIYKRR